jgi:uncharacterized protein YdiU (UPF0061 family)
MPNSLFQPSTAHANLGDGFFDVVEPARFPVHIPRYRNQRWAAAVGLGDLDAAGWERHFARFEPLPGSHPQPLALRYHGHQFRAYNPDIGDGRGFLFAQLIDGTGRLLDLGTKGSGQTPFSRFGDGRLTLKGGVREVLATELLEALGVYTSKSFSLFETGEGLYRGDEPSPTRSSVLVRLSHSHIRFGTFQRFLADNDAARVGALIDHIVAYHMPDCARPSASDQVVAVYRRVAENVARMSAQWMAAGFVHGVLNTDNTVVTGESFDYGPYRFLPHFDPGFTAAYFDQTGLYAFGRQPISIKWNLARLGECLTLLVPIGDLEPVLAAFDGFYLEHLRAAVLRRLGLAATTPEADTALVEAWFGWLGETRVAWEPAWFDAYGGPARLEKALCGPRGGDYRDTRFAALCAMLDAREPAPEARLDDLYFAGDHPTTLIWDEIEALWAPIAERDDWSAFHAKLDAIARTRTAYGFAAIP